MKFVKGRFVVIGCIVFCGLIGTYFLSHLRVKSLITPLPVIDASSEESYQQSLKYIQRGLSEKEQEKLTIAISLLVMENLRKKQSDFAVDDMNSFRQQVNGKNYKQIIEYVDKMMLRRMYRAKQYAQQNMSASYHETLQAVQKGTSALNTVEILSPLLMVKESGKRIISSKIKNNSNQTINEMIGGGIIEIDGIPNILIFRFRLLKPLKPQKSVRIGGEVRFIRNPDLEEGAINITKEIIARPLFVFYNDNMLWGNIEFAKSFDKFLHFSQIVNEIEAAGTDWRSLFTIENVTRGYFPNDEDSL